MHKGLEFRRVIFCFSSGRRHTRLRRDWSSDVCSSDLWLHYTTLQQGLIKDAEAIFAIQQKDMQEGIQSQSNLSAGKYYPRMLAAAIIETAQWQKAGQLTPPDGWKPKSYASAATHFVRGFAAAMQGNIEEARKHLAELKTIGEKGFRKNFFKRPEKIGRASCRERV